MNSYTCAVSEKEIQKIKTDLGEKGFEFKDLPYGFFQAFHKTLAVNLSLYHSKKCVVQGKGTEDFVRFYLEPEILKTFALDYAHLEYEEKIGMDESGKGDFFGPLAVASVFLPKACFNEFKEAGVMDNKKIHDKKILILDAMIQKKLPCKTIVVGPEKYNTLYERFRNLNIMLAWAHAAALRDLSSVCSAKKALLDQFAAPYLVESKLEKMGVSITLEQKTHAESDLAVACASIVARASFLKGLKTLSEKFSMEFPKGAGAPVNKTAKNFVNQFGREALKSVAKIHFRNATPFMNTH